MWLIPVCFGNGPLCSCLSFKEREAGTGKDCCSTVEVYTGRAFLMQLHRHPWQAEMFFTVTDSPLVTKPCLYWIECTFLLLALSFQLLSSSLCNITEGAWLGISLSQNHGYGHAEINLFSQTALVHWFGYKQVQSLQSRAFCWEGL